MKLAAALAAAAIAVACSRTEPPRHEVAVRTLDVGVHRVEVRLSEASDVELVDVAPATPAGMREELSVARELWNSGDRKEAQRHLRAIPIGSALLPEMKAPSIYASAWSRLQHVPGNLTAAQAEEQFETLRAGLEMSSPPSLATVVDWALPTFDGMRNTSLSHTSGGSYQGQEIDTMAGRHDARRRDVVTTTSRTVHGRPAIEVETWDNLTHARPRRMTFVVHADRLLVIASAPAGERQSLAAYEAARDSLVFRN